MAERSDLQFTTDSFGHTHCSVNGHTLTIVCISKVHWTYAIDGKTHDGSYPTLDAAMDIGCVELLNILNAKTRFCIVNLPSYESIVWHDQNSASYLDYDATATFMGLKLAVYKRKDDKIFNVMVIDSDNDMIGEVELEKNFRKESSAKRAAFRVARDYRYSQLGEMGA